MANAKISALTSASLPLAGTEVLPLVQSSTTKKVTAADVIAGITVSSGFSTTITGGGTVYVGASNSYGPLALLKNQVGNTKIGVSNNDGTANSGAYFSSYYSTTEIGAFGHYWDGGAFINRIKYFGKQEFAEGTTVRVRFEQTSGDITAVTGNFVVGTSGKGITDSTGGTTLNFSSSAITANAPVVATLFKTSNGTTSAANNTFTTIYTTPTLNNGTYIVSCNVPAADPVNYSAVSLVTVDATVLRATALQTAGLLAIQVSGQNIQARQQSGATANIVWAVTRVA